MRESDPPAIVASIHDLRQVVRLLEQEPEDEGAAKAYMAGFANIAKFFKENGAIEGDAPGSEDRFEKIWRELPVRLIRANYFGLGDLILRRMITVYRRYRDAELQRAIAKWLEPQDAEKPAPMRFRGQAIMPHPLARNTHLRFLAAEAEVAILHYDANPNPSVREDVLEAIQNRDIKKYIPKQALWKFMTVDHCRQVEESVFAGNRRDQIRTLRSLTRLLIQIQKIKPPNEKRLVDTIYRSLADSMLRADRPVGVGVLEFLRDTQNIRSVDILNSLEGDSERLEYVNFYYWATGKAREPEWYLTKFGKYFKRPLKFQNEAKGFMLGTK